MQMTHALARRGSHTQQAKASAAELHPLLEVEARRRAHSASDIDGLRLLHDDDVAGAYDGVGLLLALFEIAHAEDVVADLRWVCGLVGVNGRGGQVFWLRAHQRLGV